MTTPSPKNIPLNKEHVEAYQAEVDAKRQLLPAKARSL